MLDKGGLHHENRTVISCDNIKEFVNIEHSMTSSGGKS